MNKSSQINVPFSICCARDLSQNRANFCKYHIDKMCKPKKRLLFDICVLGICSYDTATFETNNHSFDAKKKNNGINLVLVIDN